MTDTSFSQKMLNFVNEKFAPVMAKIDDNPIVSIIKNSLVGTIPIIIMGSLFMVLGALGQPWIGKNEPLLPFLAPFAGKLLLVFNLTMGIMSLYVAVSIAINYAKKYKLDINSSAIIGLMAFLLGIVGEVSDGMISIGSFGAQGLFATFVIAFISMYIYRKCIENNIIIKMPEGVPPQIGNAFSALIPIVFIVLLTWGIRTVIGFDLVSVLAIIMKPIFNAADSIWVYTLKIFLELLLWAGGLHGSSMLQSIVSPLKLQFITENAEALASGVSPTNLPRIWTTGLWRITVWPATIWSLMFWMYKSKLKHVKSLAIASTPGAIFTIIEPIIFGLPVVMNPFLIVPFILSGTIASFITYGAQSLQLTSRFFAEVPWATPPPVLALLGSGDWKNIVLVAINVLVGIVIYYPFFKAYEKHELEKQSQN